jgi:ATP-dependent exoDNAse (exonuclease V) beta subunit
MIADDQIAREKFRTELDRNFCVIAGAGAGKTHAIVERILGVPRTDALSRLVVVTYTNSAAQEFRRRVREALLTSTGPLDVSEKLLSLERAFFGTIHSFCLAQVRAFRSELNLPEELRLLDDEERHRAWQRFVTDSPDVLELAGNPVARQLLRFCTLEDLLRLARDFRPAPIRSVTAMDVRLPDIAAVEAMPVRANSLQTKERAIKALREFLAAMQQNDGYIELPAHDCIPLSNRISEELRPTVEWLEGASYWFANELAHRFRARCLRQGWLTYRDQIDLCLELLERPAAREELRSRRYSIILDEAQDTDHQMFRVLVELTRRPGEPCGTWPGTGSPPEAGRLSMVGDPRQTIYDRPGTDEFERIAAAFDQSAGSAVLRFSVSHRCSANNVSRVNELFGDLRLPSVRFADLEAAADAPAGYVYRLPFALPEEATGVDIACEYECRQIAQWLFARQPAGLGLQYWNEIAILAPRHDWLAIMADALREFSIPFAFFKSQIARGLVPGYSWPTALVYTLVHPWDRFERFGVLREVFGIPDTDLARRVHQLGEPSAALSAAEELLAELATELHTATSVYRFLEAVICRTELRERLEAVGLATAPLDHLRSEALEAGRRGATIWEWLQRSLDALALPAPPAGEGGNRIQLITCHSAKGLEWPVVIPLGVCRAQRARTGRYPRIVLERDETFVVWSRESSRARRELEAEKLKTLRLFYVTLTRARHGLILPFPSAGWARAQPGAAFADFIPGSIEAIPPPPSDPLPNESRVSTRGHELKPGTLGEESREPAEDRLVLDRTVQRPAVELIRPYALVDKTAPAEALISGEIGSYDYGRWWHSWVEHFPWHSSERERFGYTQAIATPFRERALRETALFRSSSALERLLSEGAWFRTEVPFSYAVAEDRWMEGVIDLLVGTQRDSLWIVDWKTNQQLPDETEEAFTERLRATYTPQLEAYAAVIEQGFRRKVSQRLIYSTVLGRFV